VSQFPVVQSILQKPPRRAEPNSWAGPTYDRSKFTTPTTVNPSRFYQVRQVEIVANEFEWATAIVPLDEIRYQGFQDAGGGILGSTSIFSAY
jgi:hypothetical protein